MEYPDYVVLPPYADIASCMATNKNNKEFGDKVDAVVEKFMVDGTFIEIDKKWFSGDESNYELEPVTLTGKNGTFVASVSGMDFPYTFYKDNKLVGSEIDMYNLIAKELDMDVRFEVLDFAGMLAGIATGKIDISANVAYSDERAKIVRFSRSYDNSSKAVVIVKKAETNPAQTDFFESITESFNKTFIVESRYKLIIEGLMNTMIISIMSVLLGSLLGALICKLRMSAVKIVSSAAKFYIRLIQGIPIVLILMIMFYIVFAKVEINPVLVAIIAFALNLAAYSSEIFRTAIEATDKGQIEAALALGYTPRKSFIKITLPQAMRHILPIFKGEFVSLVKTTSVVGYIAIKDLTKMSDIIRSRTFDPFFPLFATAAIYFIITYVFIALLNKVEFSIDPMKRKRIIKGVKA